MLDINKEVVEKIELKITEYTDNRDNTKEGAFDNSFDFEFTKNKYEGKVISYTNFKASITKRLRSQDPETLITSYVKELTDETKGIRKLLGEAEAKDDVDAEHYRAVGMLNGKIDGNNEIILLVKGITSLFAREHEISRKS